MIKTLEQIQGLIAGEGELPVQVAQQAFYKGHEVIAVSLCGANKQELMKYCKKVYSCGPGELKKILDFLKAEKVNQLTFIGKVSKGMLFKKPKLDSKAIYLMKTLKNLNDDNLMLGLINELEKENITTLDQTLFIKEIMVKKGTLGCIEPTDEQKQDIEYGFNLAKEMGRIDIGQSVVVQNKMVLAVEAIEGTDEAIKRGCSLGDGAAVVVKVAKPNQDQRFDIPTVGLRTLKAIQKNKGKVLAIEAGETFILQQDEMIKYADKNNIVVVAV